MQRLLLESMGMDPFHLDQGSESSGLFLLLQGYGRRFDLGYSCLQDAWPKVTASPAYTTEYLTQDIVT